MVVGPKFYEGAEYLHHAREEYKYIREGVMDEAGITSAHFDSQCKKLVSKDTTEYPIARKWVLAAMMVQDDLCRPTYGQRW